MTASRKKTIIFIAIVSVLVIAITAISVKTVRDYLKDRYEELERQFLLMSHPIKYSEYVEKYANEWNTELDIYFIYAVIKTESDFNPEAVSNAGARGLMQIIEDTFDWMQDYSPMRRELTEYYEFDDLFDPEIGIKFGTLLFSFLFERYECRDAVIAAYHAGWNAVSAWLADERYSKDGIKLDKIPEDFPNTRHYVNKVNNAYDIYIRLYVTEAERNQ